jgi:hypothetical protein
LKFDPGQLQEMLSMAREKYAELQKKMEETVVEASAGGGSVTVRMNGRKQILSLTIDPEAVRSGDVEMLQDLVLAAVNEAARKAEEEMKKGMGLGGMLGIGD